MRLRPDNLDNIAEIYLGQKEAPIEEFRSFETRFGITLPFQSLSSNNLMIKISPSPVDRCTVILRNEQLTKPCVLKGDLFIPVLPVPPEKFKFLIRSELLSLEFTSGSVSIEPVDDIGTRRHSATGWADYWSCILAFTKEGGELEVVSDAGKADFAIIIQEPALEFDAETCSRWMNLCERLSSLYTSWPELLQDRTFPCKRSARKPVRFSERIRCSKVRASNCRLALQELER